MYKKYASECHIQNWPPSLPAVIILLFSIPPLYERFQVYCTQMYLHNCSLYHSNVVAGVVRKYDPPCINLALTSLFTRKFLKSN